VSIYIYCPRKSEGAFELVKALDAQRLRRFDGLNFWDKKARFHPAKGDVIVCWGASVPEMEGLRVLNSMNEPMNKYEELKNLAEHGVPTLTSYLDLPIELMNDRSRFIARHDDHQGETTGSGERTSHSNIEFICSLGGLSKLVLRFQGRGSFQSLRKIGCLTLICSTHGLDPMMVDGESTM
jgi:hypothetical protein